MQQRARLCSAIANCPPSDPRILDGQKTLSSQAGGGAPRRRAGLPGEKAAENSFRCFLFQCVGFSVSRLDFD